MMNNLLQRKDRFLAVLLLIIAVIMISWILRPFRAGAGPLLQTTPTPSVGVHLGNQINVDWSSRILYGTSDVSAWDFNANGERLGLWMQNAAGTNLDDFGGGTSP